MAVRDFQSAAMTAGALLATLMLAAAPGAHAQEAGAPCAVQPHYPLPQEQAQLQSLAARLEPLSLERACFRNAQFQAYRGAVLLALGEHAAAIEPLERALLIQPDFPGAELDLAVAFARTGQSATASAILRQVEQRTDLPEPLREALARNRDAVAQAAAAPPMRNRWQLTLMGGGESNLNNAPAVNQLTLTLPNGLGRQTLPLAPGSLPQRGAALLGVGQWQGVRPEGDSLWVLQAEGRWRQTDSSATQFRQLDAAATWLEKPLADRQWIARAAATWLEFGGSPLVRSLRGMVQYQFAGIGGSSCRPALGAETDSRRFPLASSLNGLYGGALFSVSCQGHKDNGSDPALSTFQIRSGVDHPDAADRPGGNQRRAEVRAQWDRPVASPWRGVLGPGRVGMLVSYVRQRDASGYSPLLEDNAMRQTRRASLQLDASFSLGGGLFAVGTAEAADQRSNLPAFTGRQRSLYLGLRWELM